MVHSFSQLIHSPSNLSTGLSTAGLFITSSLAQLSLAVTVVDIIRIITILVAVQSLLAAGCTPDESSRTPPPSPRAQQSTMPVVGRTPGLLYSFFNRRAEMKTVEHPSQVDPTSASAVMLTDPTQATLINDQIFVANLKSGTPGGAYKVWIMPKSAWLDLAVPKLSQIKLATLQQVGVTKVASRKTRQKHRVARSTPPSTEAATVSASQQQPRVIIFTTSWCPSCRAAKAYFTRRGVKYLELDVERDQRAAQQFMAIQQKYGLKQGAVPLIVVNGKVFQGFSVQQIESALATS